MTNTVDFFTTITVMNEQGADVPRYTNPRAHIDLDAYRRYASSDGIVDVAVLGTATLHDPADPHAGVDADGTTRVFDGLIPNVHMDDNPAGILAATVGVLAEQGFALTGGWTRDGNVYTADLTPTDDSTGPVAQVVQQLTESRYPKVAEHTLGVPAAAVDAAITRGLVRVVRVQPTLHNPNGERMLALSR